MGLIARKSKNRTVVEAILLEDSFSEETLKDEKALHSLAEPFGFVRESDGARSKRRCPALWKKTPNITALSSSYRPAPTARGHQTVIDREFLTSPEYREIKKLFTDLSAIWLPPYSMEDGETRRS